MFSSPRQHHQSSASTLLSRLCYLGEDDTVVCCFPLHAAKGHSPCPCLIFIPCEIRALPCSSTVFFINFFHCAWSRKSRVEKDKASYPAVLTTKQGVGRALQVLAGFSPQLQFECWKSPEPGIRNCFPSPSLCAESSRHASRRAEMQMEQLERED